MASKFFDLKNKFDEPDIESDYEHEEEPLIIKCEEACMNCNSDQLQVDCGIVICTQCGAENGIVISTEQDWRYYGQDDNKNTGDPSRCGFAINPLLPDSSQNTIILGKGANYGYKKLHKWGAVEYKEKKLIKIFGTMNQNTYNTGITKSVLDKAEVMYNTIDGINDRRGNVKKGIIAACIFESCKDKGMPRSAKELSAMYDIKSKKMTSGFKQYKEMMFYQDRDYAKSITPTSSRDFILAYGKQLNLPQEAIDMANNIAKIADDIGIILENTPPSVAVGTLCFAIEHYGIDITKKTVAETCKKSEVTIAKTLKKLNDFKPYLNHRCATISIVAQ